MPPVIQHDGGYRSARALRRLGVEAGHSERAVAHQVQQNLSGLASLEAYHQGNAEAR